ncbi:T9SS type A sorting domain-containing protein, partial [candidate division KSB1 bacterium]
GTGNEYVGYFEQAQYLTTHNLTITGLIPGTQYHYRITSRDMAGNRIEGADRTFATKTFPDLNPPLLVDGPKVAAISDRSAVVVWRTNEIANSFLDYGESEDLGSAIGDENYLKQHRLTLTGLEKGTKYHFKVGSQDPSGNLATPLAEGTFTTRLQPDSKAPSFPRNLTALPRNAKVILKWDPAPEDDLAGYIVIRSAAGGPFAVVATMVADPTYLDEGLNNDTEYTYLISAVDLFQNKSIPSKKVITVPSTSLPPDPFDLIGPVDNDAIRDTLVFSWYSAPDPTPDDGVIYSLYYDISPTFPNPTVISGLTDTTYVAAASMPADQYYWKVVALSDGVERTSSQTNWTFTFVTSIELSSFTATTGRAGAVLEWRPAKEEKIRGYRLLRSDSEKGIYEVITPKIIRPGRTKYKYIDRTARLGSTCYYNLEALSLDGGSTSFGPLALDMVSILPRQYALSQNYPNPFNPETTIQFALPDEGFVSLRIYNINGQLVRTLKEERAQAGYYRVRWDGRDSSGREMGSGIYFYRIEAGEFIQTRRMVLLK